MTLTVQLLFQPVVTLCELDSSDPVWPKLSSAPKSILTMVLVSRYKPTFWTSTTTIMVDQISDVGVQLCEERLFSKVSVPGVGYAWLTFATLSTIIVYWIDDPNSDTKPMLGNWSVVFDMDDTLIFNPNYHPLPTVPDPSVLFYVNDRPPYCIMDDPTDTPVLRPHIKEFLALVCDHFQTIAVCSCSLRNRVKCVTQLIDPDHKTILKNKFVVGREDLLTGQKSISALHLPKSTTLILDDQPLSWSLEDRPNVVQVYPKCEAPYLNGIDGGEVGTQILQRLIQLFIQSEAKGPKSPPHTPPHSPATPSSPPRRNQNSPPNNKISTPKSPGYKTTNGYAPERPPTPNKMPDAVITNSVELPAPISIPLPKQNDTTSPPASNVSLPNGYGNHTIQPTNTNTNTNNAPLPSTVPKHPRSASSPASTRIDSMTKPKTRTPSAPAKARTGDSSPKRTSTSPPRVRPTQQAPPNIASTMESITNIIQPPVESAIRPNPIRPATTAISSAELSRAKRSISSPAAIPRWGSATTSASTDSARKTTVNSANRVRSVSNPVGGLGSKKATLPKQNPAVAPVRSSRDPAPRSEVPSAALGSNSPSRVTPTRGRPTQSLQSSVSRPVVRSGSKTQLSSQNPSTGSVPLPAKTTSTLSPTKRSVSTPARGNARPSQRINAMVSAATTILATPTSPGRPKSGTNSIASGNAQRAVRRTQSASTGSRSAFVPNSESL